MPVDRKTVEEQLSAIGEGERWWENADVRALTEVLNPDERVLAIVNGKMRVAMLARRNWLVVVTTARLICLRGGTYGRRQLEVPVGQVTGMSHRMGVLRASVSVTTQRNRVHRIRLAKADALKLIGALSAMFNRIGATPGMALDAQALGLVQQAELARVYDRVELLEEEVERLRQQVDFMEDLLRRTQELRLLEEPAQAITSSART